MSPIKPAFERVVPALRRAMSRMRAGHAVALSVVAAAAFGLAGLRAVELPGPRPIDESDRLRIEVVHPVEPEIVPGSVMDVGELVNGFQGVPPPLPTLTDVAWSHDEDWNADDERWPPIRAGRRQMGEERSWDSRADPEPRPDRPSPVRAVQRWFGFDAPRRDFQAERAARRARIEAMEREARERHVRERYASERYRRERAEDERYAWERRRDEARYAPRWRDDRAHAGEVDRPPAYAPPEAAFDHVSAPPPSGPRPYAEFGR
ncbi:MAG: hypothetical protein KL785_04270 [Brevundimonas sp.]|nr:hypothetical protein [Brevundimonas sp.]